MNPLERIKSIMRLERIKQADLATALGRSSSYISLLLKSKNPTWKTIHRVAEALGYDVDVVFTRK